MSGSRVWTPEDEDRLRALAEAKRTLTFAAKELMRTESAVAGRAYKLGIKFGKPKSRGLGARKGEKPASQ
jgi:hypothetical protein